MKDWSRGMDSAIRRAVVRWRARERMKRQLEEAKVPAEDVPRVLAELDARLEEER